MSMKNNKSRFKTAKKHVKQIMKTEDLLKMTRDVDLIENNNETLEEDDELNKIADARKNQKRIKVSIDEL